MSSEVAYLKTTVSDKERQVENLHRALEDGAILESSMRGEIEQQHVRCEELECEIQGFQVIHTNSSRTNDLHAANYCFLLE